MSGGLFRRQTNESRVYLGQDDLAVKDKRQVRSGQLSKPELGLFEPLAGD